MEGYSTYPTAAEQNNAGYGGTPPHAQEQQTQVGPEWGQQFVDNFFQTQPAGGPQGAHSLYTSGEYVNSPNNVNYGGPPPAAGAPLGCYNAIPQMYTTGQTQGGAQGAYNQVSYSAGYYEPNRAQQAQAGYALPQFQAPQYSSYAPQGGSQVYMMPPVVKKSSSKKKKQGICC
eukprot:GHVS01103642.1.p1 GENE.GHVS01103642.1~~GHVS01103642.1.p1  ORF type:complete len:173 (+),score=33.47 GHVS01103642.1:165-683(+)